MVLCVFTDILLIFKVSVRNNGQWATGHLGVTVNNWQQPERQCFTEIYTQTKKLNKKTIKINFKKAID